MIPELSTTCASGSSNRAGERTVQQIADLFGVPRTTVYGHLKGAGQHPRHLATAPGESPS